MNERKILITGIGVITGYGIGKQSLWQSLIDCKPIFKEITGIKMAPIKSKLAGQIDLKIENIKKLDLLITRANKFCLLSYIAAEDAIKDATLTINNDESYNIGVLVGTSFGHPVIHQYSDMLDPIKSQYIYLNVAGSLICIKNNIKGYLMTFSMGEISGAAAVEMAVNLIKWKKCNVVIVGATDVLSRYDFLYYKQLNEISPVDDKEEKCVPFDEHRNGTIFSEGSAFVVLEEKNHALRRNAKIYGEIIGCGSHFIPGISFNNRSESIKFAMKKAIQRANLQENDIGLIYAAANGSRILDSIEADSISNLFAKNDKLLVSSIKSLLGETKGVSGIFNLIAAVLTLNEETVIPIKGFKNSENKNFKIVSEFCKIVNVKAILCNSMSYCGSATSLIISKYQ